MSEKIFDFINSTEGVGIGRTIDSNDGNQVVNKLPSFFKRKIYISCTEDLEYYLNQLGWEDVDDDI